MTGGPATGTPVYLVKGDDPSLVAQRARVIITELVGSHDPSLVVEEHGGPTADDLDTGAVLDALTTPPFLVDRRVVVVRDAGRLAAGDGARLAAYLASPLPSSVLVLVGGGGTVPRALSTAVQAVGTVIDTTVGMGAARTRWLADRLREAPVRLDGPATALLAEHLGGDMGRLAGLLDTLASAYGPHARVTADALAPFLGEAGGVPPWDLTDAIDAGKIEPALGVLRRMLGPAGFHPLAVVTVLHRHYRQMLRLDGSGAASPEEAAAVLGLRSAFPAKKALTQGRRLGAGAIARAIHLVAGADLDLRGGTALPDEVILEILVGRLCRLAPRRG